MVGPNAWGWGNGRERWSAEMCEGAGARSVGADPEGIGAIKHLGSRRPEVHAGLSISGTARGATGARKRGSRGF